jgi:hypothetical protein
VREPTAYARQQHVQANPAGIVSISVTAIAQSFGTLGWGTTAAMGERGRRCSPGAAPTGSRHNQIPPPPNFAAGNAQRANTGPTARA